MNIEHKSMTISELVDLDKQDLLRVNPEYQRAPEWNLKQERLLIDSLLRNYPIPMFYLHKKVNKTDWATNTNFYIVDGQQRKNAITRFVRNEFALFDPARDKSTGLSNFQRNIEIPWAGHRFNSMPESLRIDLLGTILTVVIIESDNDNEIRDLFVRLQAGLPLSAQEKRDAWPGEFTQFVFETAGKTSPNHRWQGHDFFRRILKGTPARGNMRKNCTSLFMQLYSRRSNEYAPDSFTSTNAADLDNFYKHHIDFDSKLEASQAPRFRKILDEATNLLGDAQLPKIEIHMAHNVILLIDRLMDNFSVEWRHKFVEAFIEFQERLLKAKREKSANNPYWAKYGMFTGVSAASRDRAEMRYRFFEEKMLELMSPLKRRDGTRAFSSAEREIVYYRDRRKCYKCGEDVAWIEAEIDHALPHALGGETTLDNARLVHGACHDRGMKALNRDDSEGIVGVVSDKPWEDSDSASIGRENMGESAQTQVRFRELFDANLIETGCIFEYNSGGNIVSAEYEAPSTFRYSSNGNTEEYPHFSRLVRAKIGSRNIWPFTTVTFPNGEERLLRDIRDEYRGSNVEVDPDE